MRISDWSSDVCSSDLLASSPAGLVDGRVQHVFDIAAIGDAGQRAGECQPMQAAALAQLAPRPPVHPQQQHAAMPLGTSSCRERWIPYVESWGVPHLIKYKHLK